MTESTSHVEQQVQQQIAAARIKGQAARQRRDDLAAARKRGLAHRHAAKLRNLAEREQRQAEASRHQEASVRTTDGSAGFNTTPANDTAKENS